MSRFLNFLLCLIPLILVLTNCKKDKDKYYERPANLANPIYQILQDSGKFTHYLECVDRTDYKDIISRSGFYTVFVPNDSAFEAYLKLKGVTSVQALDIATVKGIVSYSLSFNGYTTTGLTNYLGVDSMSFKRKTINQKGFYYSTDPTTKEVVAVLDGSASLTNYKYIPFFLKDYFNYSSNKFTASDYNYFYPNSVYTGYNVVDGKVVKGNILAQNGYIHITNKVIEPLMSMEEYAASKSDYSLFKQILDTFAVLTYDATLSVKYSKTPNPTVQGVTKAEYKIYPSLTFSPNMESFNAVENAGQSDGYTLFMPNNAAVTDIMKNRIARYYGQNYRNVPLAMLATFVNAHLFSSTVWPSRFSQALNSIMEDARFNPQTDVVDKYFASNGVVYGTKIVQASDLFMTVYGDVYLNPDYSLMLTAIAKIDGLKNVMTNTLNSRKTVILIPNAAFDVYGYNYNLSTNTFVRYNTLTDVTAEIKRIVSMHVAPNVEITNMYTGKGVVETFSATTGQEELFGYDHGTIYGPGNQDSVLSMPAATAITGFSPSNGSVYKADKLLWYSSKNLGYHIKKYFGPNSVIGGAAGSKFFTYLNNSAYVFTPVGTVFNELSATEKYTVFIPTDAAIDQAIAAGDLPSNSNPTAGTASGDADILKITNFIYYHILNKSIALPDGLASHNGTFLTFLKIGPVTKTATITTQASGSMVITDNNGRTANLILANSNILSSRAVIHQIDNYLKY